MPWRNDLTHTVADAATNPMVVAPAATLTTGLGLNELFGWVEHGIGLSAAMMGLLVTVAMWRKLRTERRESELRIRVLEEKLSRNDLDSPLP